MIKLTDYGQVVLNVPHDWGKFRDYLISSDIVPFDTKAQEFKGIESVSQPGEVWEKCGDIPLGFSKSVYRLEGDVHWRFRLFYVENQRAFVDGIYALECANPKLGDWTRLLFAEGSITPAFISGNKYRIVPVAKEKTQQQIFYEAVAKEGRRDELFLDMLKTGDMTYTDLQALIKRRPEVYGKYSGFLDYLKPKEYLYLCLHDTDYKLYVVRSLNEVDVTTRWDNVWQEASDYFQEAPDLLISEGSPLFNVLRAGEMDWSEATVVEV